MSIPERLSCNPNDSNGGSYWSQQQNSCSMRKLLTRKPDQRVVNVPVHLKEEFLTGTRNSCQILHEYCQIRRLKHDYTEVDAPDVAGMQSCWCVCALVDGVRLPTGFGKNKKLAKQDAAERALLHLFDIEPVLSTLRASIQGSTTSHTHSAFEGVLEQIRQSIPTADVNDKVQSYLESTKFTMPEKTAALSSRKGCNVISNSTESSPRKTKRVQTGWSESEDECQSDSEIQTVMESSKSLHDHVCENVPVIEGKPADRFTCLFQAALKSILTQVPDCSLVSKTYSAIIVQIGDSDPGKVIALASGSGHLDSNEWPPHYLGTVIHDCHSIVIARRALIKFLFHELSKHLNSGSHNSIFESKPDQNGRWSVRRAVRLHVVMSQPPCGAAQNLNSSTEEAEKHRQCSQALLKPRTERLRSLIKERKGLSECSSFSSEFETIEKESVTVKSQLVCGGADHNDTLFYLRSLSCSDKILRWNYLGWEGSLLGCFINPIFMSSFAFLSSFSPSQVSRALVKRTNQTISAAIVSQIPQQFKTAPELNLDCVTQTRARVDEPSTLLSLNWCCLDHLPELVNPVTGTVSAESPFQLRAFRGQSRLCKKAFLNRFTKHLQSLQTSQIPDTYREAKKLACKAPQHYSLARKLLDETFPEHQRSRLKPCAEKLSFVNF